MHKFNPIFVAALLMTSLVAGCLGGDVEDEIDFVEADTSELESRITDLETQISELENQNSALTENLAVAEAELSNKTAALAHCEENLSSMQMALDNLTTERDALQQTLDELEAENTNLTTERDALQQELEESEDENTDLEDEITELNATIEDLEDNITDLNDDIEDLNDDIEDLNDDIDELDEEIDELEDNIDDLEDTIEDLEHTIEEIQDSLSSLLTVIHNPTPEQKDSCMWGNPPVVYDTGYDNGTGGASAGDGILEDDEIVISEDGTTCLGSYGEAFQTQSQLNVFNDKLLYVDTKIMGAVGDNRLFELQYKITDGTYSGTEALVTIPCFIQSSSEGDSCGGVDALQVGDQLFFHIYSPACPFAYESYDYGMHGGGYRDDYMPLGDCSSDGTPDEKMFSHRLYVTDGTLEGTIHLGNFKYIGEMVELESVGNPPEDKLVFVAAYREGDSENNGFELWTSDGTVSGTHLILNINTYTEGHGTDNQDDASALTPLTDLYVHFGNVYFGADDGDFGNELWRTDGTDIGTVLIKNLHLEQDSDPNHENCDEVSGSGEIRCHSYPLGFASFGNALLFRADNGDYHQLWISSGSASGTKTVDSHGFGLHTPDNGCRSFGLYGPWGQSSCGIYVTENVAYLAVCANSYWSDNDEHVYDSCYDNPDASEWNKGVELLRTDGTHEGTWLISPGQSDNEAPQGICPGTCWGIGESKDIPGYVSWDAVVMDDTLYFSANNSDNGVELWKSDGTNDTTEMVLDICPGDWETVCHKITNGGTPRGFFLSSDTNTLYFSATDSYGTELWRSDGTEEGTEMVFNINRDSFVEKPDYCNRNSDVCYMYSTGSSHPGMRTPFIIFNQMLFFSAISHTDYQSKIWWLDINQH